MAGSSEWAGEYREVERQQGRLPVRRCQVISPLMEEFESDVLTRNTPLKKQSQPDSALALAETHTELLLIHPFREGNGRVARLLVSLMALQRGLERPRFEALLEQRKPEYFAAVRAGLDRNYQPMRSLFDWLIDGAGL